MNNADKPVLTKGYVPDMAAFKRESWIKNVMRIYPEKTRQEVEKLHEQLWPKQLEQKQAVLEFIKWHESQETNKA